MPLKILIFALAAFFTISPVSKAIAASEFVTDDTALWTTTDTSTSTSATTSSLTMDSISTDTSTSSTSQATSTPSFQSARHGYDELDRLKWTQYEDGTVISYLYDKVGNRTAKNTDAGALAGFTITATTSGYGAIIPPGTITVASGNSQTFFIEQGIPPNGTGCPSGYAFVTANNRCEKAPPDCPSGYSFNPASNQCEQIVTSSYQASCPTGYSPDGATCVSQYTATLSGVMIFALPVYSEQILNCGADSCECSGVASGDLTILSAGACSNYLNGYVATSSVPGAIPIYSKQALSCGADSCECSGVASGDLTTLSAGTCSNYLTGYISATFFPGAIPVYSVQTLGCGADTCECSGMDSGKLTLLSTGSCSNYLKGYLPATSGSFGGAYSCPQGGTLSGNVCTLTTGYVCPDGGTLSGSTCQVSTTNMATPFCTGGTLNSPPDGCYYYLPGTLAGFIVDDVAVSLGTLPSMQGPTGRRYYYTFANVAANHAITANFTDASSPPCIDYPARLAGATPANFLSLQSAYNAAASSDTIQGNMYDHFESLLLDRNISVTLDGGYSCDFGSITGNLTVKGAMTIANGSVVVNGNIILAAP